MTVLTAQVVMEFLELWESSSMGKNSASLMYPDMILKSLKSRELEESKVLWEKQVFPQIFRRLGHGNLNHQESQYLVQMYLEIHCRRFTRQDLATALFECFKIKGNELSYYNTDYNIADPVKFKMTLAYGYCKTAANIIYSKELCTEIFNLIKNHCSTYTQYSLKAFEILNVWMKYTKMMGFFNDHLSENDEILDMIILSNWQSSIKEIAQINAYGLYPEWVDLMNTRYGVNFGKHTAEHCCQTMSWHNLTKFVILHGILKHQKIPLTSEDIRDILRALENPNLQEHAINLYLTYLSRIDADEWNKICRDEVIAFADINEEQNTSLCILLWEKLMTPTFDILPDSSFIDLWKTFIEKEMVISQSYLLRIAIDCRISLFSLLKEVRYLFGSDGQDNQSIPLLWIRDKRYGVPFAMKIDIPVIALNAFYVCCSGQTFMSHEALFTNSNSEIINNNSINYELCKWFLYFQIEEIPLDQLKLFEDAFLLILDNISSRKSDEDAKFLIWLHEFLLNCFQPTSSNMKKLCGLIMYKEIVLYIFAIKDVDEEDVEELMKNAKLDDYFDKESLLAILRVCYDTNEIINSRALDVFRDVYSVSRLTNKEQMSLIDVIINEDKECFYATSHIWKNVFKKMSKTVFHQYNNRLKRQIGDLIIKASQVYSNLENIADKASCLDRLTNIMKRVSFLVKTFSLSIDKLSYGNYNVEFFIGSLESILQSAIEPNIKSITENSVLKPKFGEFIKFIVLSIFHLFPKMKSNQPPYVYQRPKRELLERVFLVFEELFLNFDDEIVLKCLSAYFMTFTDVGRRSKANGELELVECLIPTYKIDQFFYLLLPEQSQREKRVYKHLKDIIEACEDPIKNKYILWQRKHRMDEDIPKVTQYNLELLCKIVEEPSLQSYLFEWLERLTLVTLKHIISRNDAISNACRRLINNLTPLLTGPQSNPILNFASGNSYYHFITHFPKLAKELLKELDRNELLKNANYFFNLLSGMSYNVCGLVDRNSHEYVTKLSNIAEQYLGDECAINREYAGKLYAATMTSTELVHAIEHTIEHGYTENTNLAHGFACAQYYLLQRCKYERTSRREIDKMKECSTHYLSRLIELVDNITGNKEFSLDYMTEVMRMKCYNMMPKANSCHPFQVRRCDMEVLSCYFKEDRGIIGVEEFANQLAALHAQSLDIHYNYNDLLDLAKKINNDFELTVIQHLDNISELFVDNKTANLLERYEKSALNLEEVRNMYKRAGGLPRVVFADEMSYRLVRRLSERDHLVSELAESAIRLYNTSQSEKYVPIIVGLIIKIAKKTRMKSWGHSDKPCKSAYLLKLISTLAQDVRLKQQKLAYELIVATNPSSNLNRLADLRILKLARCGSEQNKIWSAERLGEILPGKSLVKFGEERQLMILESIIKLLVDKSKKVSDVSKSLLTSLKIFTLQFHGERDFNYGINRYLFISEMLHSMIISASIHSGETFNTWIREIINCVIDMNRISPTTNQFPCNGNMVIDALLNSLAYIHLGKDNFIEIATIPFDVDHMIMEDRQSYKTHVSTLSKMGTTDVAGVMKCKAEKLIRYKKNMLNILIHNEDDKDTDEASEL